ncbi:MAG TPA: hypothetical protein VH682_20995 [Gemmataceae bacterium]|jgi:hypothetical protein
MLAFVANTTAAWGAVMNTTDRREQDHARDLLVAAKSADSAPPSVERLALVGSGPTEPMWGAKADFRSQFLTVLLRALSTWTA